MAPTEALAALPRLLPKLADRRRAMATVEAVAGPESELGDAALAMLEQQRSTLGLTRALVPVGYEAVAISD
jgi:hypothetical protein